MTEEEIKHVNKKISKLVVEVMDKIDEATRLADEYGISFDLNLEYYLKTRYNGRYIEDRWQSSDPWCSDNRGEWVVK